MKPRNPVARELASARFRKQVVPDRKKDMKPDIEVQVCPRCQSPSQPVFVHGHYQCPVCKSVIDDCCNGETCQMSDDEWDSLTKDQQGDWIEYWSEEEETDE